jgi:beta-mannanase
MLLINWKPSTSLTWQQVADGKADGVIDQEANYLTHTVTFTDPFFLTIYHEPEDNVVATPGSGMTASDYAAMYRHVVLRLRADGVTNAVTVMDYMGWYKWEQYSWFNQLWPGDDVVDWIGLDPYGTGSASDHFTAHTLDTLINRTGTGVPGYYDWATSTHPGKPIMLCEWGVSYDPASPTGQASFFDSMNAEIDNYPWLKALVYYDVPKHISGLPWTNVTLNAQAEAAYRAVANSAPFDTAKWSY